MIRKLAQKNGLPYEWIDIEGAEKEEIARVAEEYGLHEASVKDSLESDHLPKYERLSDYTFVILRVYDPQDDKEADTVKELSNKVAVFLADAHIITIHKEPWKALEHISEGVVKKGECKKPAHVLNEIVKAGLTSFNEPAAALTDEIEYFEKHVFLKNRKAPVLKGLYYLKRKSDVIRRLMTLSFDMVDKIDAPEHSNVYTRDIRDLHIKQQAIFDSLSENTNHLLNIYFNISSQKTNETIRILTIFSVFFMPLTFIVGIYGMNFEFMPELKWKWGYPGSLVLMAVITALIYVWFRRRKWL
ncbi:magnesium transporter [Filimonas zeae]|uniref:Cobalt/magnesium transport protein CorA n=1 Tax=Filimonas zeae TaxID=1737353 RepID=A0A917MYE0_9BACT|nr:CorA family divalent cation transporter [Filimonas zeae]MDR6340799.1 magnesium transporter [Filimonas zeae]GGH78402.1 cobalt/magnesium transport protein CorA [Filimonas zeae]